MSLTSVHFTPCAHTAWHRHSLGHLALTEGDTEWGDHLADHEYPSE